MDRRKRVEILFHEALALEPGARTSYLEQACSGEPGLLEEVVSLISAHEQPWSLIDSPVNYTKDQADDELFQSLIGISIGRYQVVRLIKRSGMGEVYLARDTHLPREVALKLLPLMFTGDESRLRRFILEAETASSLNHPNIITIHEIGHIRDVHYIATEYVDGQTLRERLADGPLELREAVEIAIGVTNALVASHAAGIVHRDIKPENIMIRRDGYVKVLDFGLAKLTERPDVRVDGNSPNISSMETDPGTFMGTVGYLSPEQAKSLKVDTRSDLFSLGVVLYEMIAGQNPFNRESFGAVIDAILTTEPAPLASFAPKTPASLQRVVTKALARDKLNRYQNTEDLLSDLKAVQAQIEQQVRRRKLTPRERRLRLGIGVLAVIAIALFGVTILRVLNRSRSANGLSNLSSQLRFIELYSWKSERGQGTIDARFSHDSQMIAFTRKKNQRETIWVKQASSQAEPQQLTKGSNENYWPIWSPDDQQIAFVSTREGKTGIWSTSVNGGSETLLKQFETATVRARSWSKDGRTIYYEIDNNLFALDRFTHTTTQLTNFERSASYRGHFSVAPTEKQICYVEISNGQTDIWVASIHGGSPFKVTDDVAEDRRPVWTPDGRIVFTSNRGGAFQVCIGFTNGAAPVQVTVGAADHVLSDISQDGTRLLDVTARDEAAIFEIDVNTGRESEIVSGSGLKLWPESSPDGEKLVFQSANDGGKILTNSTLFIKRTKDEGSPIPVAANGYGASWSPDGSLVAFLRFISGKPEIFLVDASGQGERQLTNGGVKTGGYNQLPTTKFGRSFCWSTEGNKIIYSSRKSGVSNVWTIGVDGSEDSQLSANGDPALFFYEPICGPNNRISFAAEARRGMEWTWSLWIIASDKAKPVFESKALLRTIGWSSTGDDVIVGAAAEGPQGYPMTVKLISISANGESHLVSVLQDTYFWTVQLAPDGAISFVSSREGVDNIWRYDITNGKALRLTSNNEPKTYFPGLTWSGNGKEIYYGKQTSLGLITMIDNFQ